MPWFWLSFADPKRPEGEQFLGVVVLLVDETITRLIEHLDESDRIDLLRERGQEADVPFYVAVQYASFLKLNPGGEVQGWELPEDAIEKIPKDLRGRLLTREQAESI